MVALGCALVLEAAAQPIDDALAVLGGDEVDEGAQRKELLLGVAEQGQACLVGELDPFAVADDDGLAKVALDLQERLVELLLLTKRGLLALEFRVKYGAGRLLSPSDPDKSRFTAETLFRHNVCRTVRCPRLYRALAGATPFRENGQRIPGDGVESLGPTVPRRYLLN